MMSVSRMPGDWPRESFDGSHIEHFFPNADQVLLERRKTPPITPYSLLSTSDIEECSPRSNPSAVNQEQAKESTEISPAPSITPNDVLIPGFGVPATENISPQSRSFLSPPTAPVECLIPRKNLRKPNTLSQTIPEGSNIHRSRSRTSLSPNLTSSPNTSLPQALDSPRLKISDIEPRSEAILLQPAPRRARDAPPPNKFWPFDEEGADNLVSQNPAWINYEPPNELLQTHSDISVELNDILLPSIRRIRDRDTEAEMRRNAAQAEMTLSRLNGSSYTSVMPNQFYVPEAMSSSLNSNLQPYDEINVPPLTPSSPQDSGYGSSPGMETNPSVEIGHPIPPKRFGGLGGIFKRKYKSRKDVNPSSARSSLEDHGSSLLTPLPSFSSDAPAQDQSLGECVSCLEDFPSPQLVHLTCHNYCGECFQGLIKTALETETQWPAKCCLNIIPSAKILSNLDNRLQLKYKQRESEWSIPAGDRVYCSRQSCGSWIAPKNVNKSTNCAKCRKCGHKSCLLCRGRFHNGNECPQDRGVQATLELAEMEGWKRCYRCSALVEHNQGCRHMTCRCKAEFCYICSARWRTCACTDRDLEGVRQRAANNRQNHEAEIALAAAEAVFINQGNVREADRLAEIEEEERQILWEVEMFVRAEAERESREAEEARLAMEAERQRQEEERLAGIHLLYQQLHEELDGLRCFQFNLLNERHEHESQAWKAMRQNHLDVVEICHAAEVKAQMEKTQKRVSVFQSKCAKEYKARRAEELRVEDKYVEELRAFWTGKPDAEYKILTARDDLRNERAQDYQFWESYRRAQLRALKDEEGRNLELLLERHEAEIRDAGVKDNIDALEMQMKKWSEQKWVSKVSMEREAMLEELQVQEYAKV